MIMKLSQRTVAFEMVTVVKQWLNAAGLTSGQPPSSLIPRSVIYIVCKSYLVITELQI